MPASRTVRKKPMVTVPTEVSAHDIVETVRSSILVLSEDLHVTSANRAFYATFGVTPEETIGRFVYDLGNGYLSSAPLRQLLETVIPEQEAIEAFEIEQDFESIGHRCFVLNARKVHRPENKTSFLLLVFDDITDVKRDRKSTRLNSSH